jgi:hypothetical protein
MAVGIPARLKRLQEALERHANRMRDLDETILYALKRIDGLDGRLRRVEERTNKGKR